jgi:protein SDA1
MPVAPFTHPPPACLPDPRELNPEMLAKKDRGRGADLTARPRAYGAAQVAERVDGAELLEQALAEGRGSSDDEYSLGGSSSDSGSDVHLDDLNSSDLESIDGEDGEAAGEGEEDGDGDEGEEGSSGSEDLGSSDPEMEVEDEEEGEEGG